MSLDGFIAGPGDAMDWVSDYSGPNTIVDEVLPAIGALLIGYRTYRLASSQEGRPYGGLWTGPMFVLTHDAPESELARMSAPPPSVDQRRGVRL
jgi:hypothetical protein